jgi:hypothetical protein
MPRTLLAPSCQRTIRIDQSLPLAPLGDCAVSSNESSVLKVDRSLSKSASRREASLIHVTSPQGTANRGDYCSRSLFDHFVHGGGCRRQPASGPRLDRRGL